MFVVGAVSQALGCDINDVKLSRTSIQCARNMNRRLVSSALQESFACNQPVQPLLLHWDGKLLPDITGGNEHVGRIAILVTGGKIEQLLGVPKIGRGTGEGQCNVCVAALENWQLKHLIEGLVFDTTSVNTGLKKGACSLLKKELGKELVWIACRHHVFEVVSSDVFYATIGPSGAGPDVQLFTRFKKTWPNIDKFTFEIPSEDVFDSIQDSLKQKVMSIYATTIRGETPGEDYQELLSAVFHLPWWRI